ncbi:MAG: hypothetical protein IJ188_08960 [Clostridia bacterium]|nr:hypothetical protein [Clostridia bacterium]
METKDYKKYAIQARGLNSMWPDELKKKIDQLNQSLSDWRLSPYAKEEKRKEVYKELQSTCDNMNKLYREILKRFLEDFAIHVPEDGKDHSTDIQNALKVIDMLGFDLDAANFRNIITPLKGSYKNMKMILDVISAKKGITSDLQYSHEITQLVDEYFGPYTIAGDYLELIDRINDAISSPIGYRFEAYTIDNSYLVTAEEFIPYSFLSCPDWIEEAGKMYSVLEGKLTSLYDGHVPTDEEMIIDKLGR